MDSVEFEKKMEDTARALKKQIALAYSDGRTGEIYQAIIANNELPLMLRIDQCLIVAKLAMRIEIEFMAMKHQPDKYSITGIKYDETNRNRLL